MYTHFIYTKKERTDTANLARPREVTKYFAIVFQVGVKEPASHPKGQREKEIWERGTKEASRNAVMVSVFY